MKKIKLPGAGQLYVVPKPLKKNKNKWIAYIDKDELLKYPANVRLDVLSMLFKRHKIYFNIPIDTNFQVCDLDGNCIGEMVYLDWIKESNALTINRTWDWYMMRTAILESLPVNPLGTYGNDKDILESYARLHKKSQEVC